MKEELKKIINYERNLTKDTLKKTDLDAEILLNDTLKKIKDKSYDFKSIKQIVVNQNRKSRKVGQYSSWTPERELCVYMKRKLDKEFNITYPVRNHFMSELFDIIKSLNKGICNYVILKFDFKDYFNSLSSEYIFNKYIAHCGLYREDKQLIKDFVSAVPFCYAGLNTSNVLAELIAKDFDEKIRAAFYDKGLIFYKRYIDDAVIILNRFLSMDDCLEIINAKVDEVFNNAEHLNPLKHHIELNPKKFQYVSGKDISTISPQTFDFLGYQFIFKNTGIEYGIAESKRKKYTWQIKRIFDKISDKELLRHVIKAYSSRVVYRVPKFKSMNWKEKGLISNYNELGNVIEYLNDDTKEFLKNIYFTAARALKITPPGYLKSTTSSLSGYNIYNNLKRNRTLLFVEGIGISKATLEKMCTQIGISFNKNSTYEQLTKMYLNKIKIGY